MKTSEVFAPAKINLTLHVTGRRDDGYHMLDSLVAFADVGDRLWLEPGSDLSIEVSGRFAAGVPTNQNNIVWQAAELAGWRGMIHLEKNLPHGAGIGGGSADAAAVLRVLGHEGTGAELGADVPVCKLARAARMTGIGDQIVPVAGFPTLHAVLCNPGIHVPTPKVFAALSDKSNAPMPPDLPSKEWLTWISAQRNDLEPPAMRLAPIIADALHALSELPGQRLARMSGSGATCFALFDDENAAARGAADLRLEHPDWWVVDCALS